MVALRRGELESQIARLNTWWRPSGRAWEDDDRDLRPVREAPFAYEPRPLADLREGGLYMLVGPRRVGKSVELKRAISALINSRVPPRRVFHAACNTWAERDLVTLVDVIDSLAPADPAQQRYVFLDEITAIKDDWIGQIGWLRDNTSLRNDCVILSGSSAEELDKARRDLAGRRGDVVESTRTLLPMGFRAFCAVIGLQLPELAIVHPRDMLGQAAADAMRELRFYLNDLVAAWEQYLQCGGLPRAVGDWINDREVSASFITAVWDVVHGDALADGEWTATQSQGLLEAFALRISSPVNRADVRRDLGDIHNDTLVRRLRRLYDSFVAWPCYREQNNRPDLAAQEKVYFVDPLYARLASLRRPDTVRPPDLTQLTEQQLGVTLLRAREHDEPGTWTDFDSLMHYRSKTRKEVDFVGAWLRHVPFEGKYTEGHWLRETQTAVAAYGRCVLATRNVLDRDGERIAVPAAILAFLLDPTSAEGRRF